MQTWSDMLAVEVLNELKKQCKRRFTAMGPCLHASGISCKKPDDSFGVQWVCT